MTKMGRKKQTQTVNPKSGMKTTLPRATIILMHIPSLKIPQGCPESAIKLGSWIANVDGIHSHLNPTFPRPSREWNRWRVSVLLRFFVLPATLHGLSPVLVMFFALQFGFLYWKQTWKAQRLAIFKKTRFLAASMLHHKRLFLLVLQTYGDELPYFWNIGCGLHNFQVNGYLAPESFVQAKSNSLGKLVERISMFVRGILVFSICVKLRGCIFIDSKQWGISQIRNRFCAQGRNQTRLRFSWRNLE